MEASKFAPSSRGGARRTLEGYIAFFPEPLPRLVELSPTVVLKLDAATAAVHRLGGVGRLLPNPGLLMRPHIRLEAVLSSRIEGTMTTLSELLRSEALDDVEDAGDVLEVVNYTRALNHGLTRLREGFPLSLRLIREIHERLMSGVRGQEKTPGTFRTSPNWIGPPGSTLSTAAFVPPPVHEMNDALTDWERFLHERGLPLLIQLAMAHYQFEVIHPFLDGNGRVGRLLLALALCERQVLHEPLLYLSVYFERRRELYYDLLLRTSQSGDFEPWFVYFLEGVAIQAADAEDRTVRLVESQRALRAELLGEGVPNSVVRLGELLFDTPFVSAKYVARQLEVSFPTAQKAIGSLVKRGVLREVTGRPRSRVYLAPVIYDAVYGDIEQAPQSMES